jgi:hypothetical protein
MPSDEPGPSPLPPPDAGSRAPLAAEPSRMATGALVLGVMGLVMCFLFVFSALALIFGLLAARQITRSNGALSGMRRARAGWILGVIGLALGGLVVANAVLSDDDVGVGLDEVEVGDCADLSQLDEQLAGLPIVACDEPHDAEVTLVGELNPGGSADFPGDDAVQAAVTAECAGDVFTNYVGVAVDDSELESFPVYPTEREWDQGEGSYACLVFAGDAELTSTVRGSNR